MLHGQFKIGSQRHFYMEPQTAVATPEEGGRMSLISSCQGTDQVQANWCNSSAVAPSSGTTENQQFWHLAVECAVVSNQPLLWQQLQYPLQIDGHSHALRS